MIAARRKVDRGIDTTLQLRHRLTASELAVLVTLSEAACHSLRLRDLCRELDWDRSRVSHQITRMQRRGLVEKTKFEGDARGVVVVITDEGLARLEEAAPEHVESVRRLVFDHMTPDQAEVLRSYLEGIMRVDNVPAAGGCPEGG